MIHAIQIALTLVFLVAGVVLLVFNTFVFVELIRSLRRRAWRSPPPPIGADLQDVLALYRAAWQRTRQFLRF